MSLARANVSPLIPFAREGVTLPRVTRLSVLWKGTSRGTCVRTLSRCLCFGGYGGTESLPPPYYRYHHHGDHCHLHHSQDGRGGEKPGVWMRLGMRQRGRGGKFDVRTRRINGCFWRRREEGGESERGSEKAARKTLRDDAGEKERRISIRNSGMVGKERGGWRERDARRWNEDGERVSARQLN